MEGLVVLLGSGLDDGVGDPAGHAGSAVEPGEGPVGDPLPGLVRHRGQELEDFELGQRPPPAVDEVDHAHERPGDRVIGEPGFLEGPLLGPQQTHLAAKPLRRQSAASPAHDPPPTPLSLLGGTCRAGGGLPLWTGPARVDPVCEGLVIGRLSEGPGGSRRAGRCTRGRLASERQGPIGRRPRSPGPERRSVRRTTRYRCLPARSQAGPSC